MLKRKKLWFIAIVVLAVLIVWNDQRFELSTDQLARVSAEAEKACTSRGLPLPPKPFTTDGCSLWLNKFGKDDWTNCCIAHDYDYWCGGPIVDRAVADYKLGVCVDKIAPHIGDPVYFGVLLGGQPWSIMPWRWGYGWPYFSK